MNSISDDALSSILSFCSPKEVLKLRQTNRRIGTSTKHDSLWKENVVKEFPDAIGNFSEFSQRNVVQSHERLYKQLYKSWKSTSVSSLAPRHVIHGAAPSPVFGVGFLDLDHVIYTGGDGTIAIDKIPAPTDAHLPTAPAPTHFADTNVFQTSSQGWLGFSYSAETQRLVLGSMVGDSAVYACDGLRRRDLNKLPARELKAALKARDPRLLAGVVERSDLVDRARRANAIPWLREEMCRRDATGTVVGTTQHGDSVATCANDGYVRWYTPEAKADGSSNWALRRSQLMCPEGVDAVAMRASDGRCFAGTKASTVVVLDPESEQPIETIHTSHQWVWALHPSDNGTLFASGTDGSMSLWDTRTGPASCIQSVRVSAEGPASGLAVNDAHARVVCSTFSGSVSMWDARNLNTPVQVAVLPHASHERCTRVALTCERIAVGSFDGRVRVWELGNRSWM